MAQTPTTAISGMTRRWNMGMAPQARETTPGTGKVYISRKFATVAELADAPALGAGGATRGGSSPSGRTGRLRRKVVEDGRGGGGCRGSLHQPPPTSTLLHKLLFPHRLDLDHRCPRFL